MDDRDAAVDRCPVARVPANFDRKRERERNTMYVRKRGIYVMSCVYQKG